MGVKHIVQLCHGTMTNAHITTSVFQSFNLTSVCRRGLYFRPLPTPCCMLSTKTTVLCDSNRCVFHAKKDSHVHTTNPLLVRTFQSKRVHDSLTANLDFQCVSTASYRSFTVKQVNKKDGVKYYCSDTKDKLQGSKASRLSEESSEEHDYATLKRNSILTVPNLLTVVRMGISPVLGYLVLQQSFMAACGLFVVAGTTDLMDGYIARRYPSQISAIGSFLDPLADKFLASILFVTLAMVDLIPLWLTVMVIARDVLLMGGGFYVRYISITPPVTFKNYFDVTNVTAQLKPMFISKYDVTLESLNWVHVQLNTALQLSLVTLTLAAPVFGYVDHTALHALWYLTACSTTVTGLAYIFAKDTFKVFKKHRKFGK